MASQPLTLKVVKNPYNLISWNINGYRESIHVAVKELLRTSNPDILFLSETKKKSSVLETYFREFPEYTTVINPNDPAQYHGVVMLVRKPNIFEVLPVDLGIPSRHDTKDGNPATGRLIVGLFNKKYIIIGTYVPNSGVKALEKLPYRIQMWDPAIFALLNHYKTRYPTIWLGDFNVAPTEIDVSHPQKMCKYAGFHPDERNSFRAFMSGGWCDIWRTQHPQHREYSWIGHSLQPNYGMRLDNIIISPNLINLVTQSYMMTNYTQSDHIPIGILIYLP